MFADALFSEAYKLQRNRTAWFWGFVFVPLVALAIGVVGVVYLHAKMREAAQMMPADIAHQTLNALAQASGPLTMLFALLGAAVLFGGEYRWETWRLLTPRNSRANLFLAKVAAYAAGTAFTVLAIGLAGTLSCLLGMVLNHSPMTWTGGSAGGFAISLLKQFAVSWAELLQAGAVGALACVVTRSILAGVITPIVVGVVQLAITAQPTDTPLATWRLLALPGLAAKALRIFFDTGAQASSQVEPGVAAQAGISLIGWIVIVFAVTIVTFQRQDLAKE